jgi:hypothetical protein
MRWEMDGRWVLQYEVDYKSITPVMVVHALHVNLSLRQ